MLKRFLFLICLLPTISFAQTKDELAILSILDKQTQAWNAGNLEQFMVGYWESDSLMYIGKSGVTYGFRSTLDSYRRNYAGPDKMGKLTFHILHLKPLGRKHYLVVGKWSLKRTAGDVGGHYTLTFAKQKGRWVIIADHSS